MSADFLDSNVLIYLFDLRDLRKRAIARALVDDAMDDVGTCISHQVVQETLNVLTSRLPEPLSPAQAARALEDILVPLWTVMPSPALYQRALDIRDRYGFSFYDSLIVAAALEAGCDRLLSEDLQDGQVIEGLRIENPFVE